MNKQQFLGASLHTGLYVYNEKLYGREVLKLNGLNFGDVIHQYGLSPQQYITPILRPLSDLTKPITHNGETFVPIVELEKIDKGIWVNGGKLMFRLTPIKNILELPFLIIEWLIKHHFNIMDESEPFIPVTEEFNPYK